MSLSRLAVGGDCAWGALVVAIITGALLFLKGTRTKTVDNTRTRIKTKPIPDDGGLDAIIVGAGVAGSALAHTLGKVNARLNRSLPLSIDHCRFKIGRLYSSLIGASPAFVWCDDRMGVGYWYWSGT